MWVILPKNSNALKIEHREASRLRRRGRCATDAGRVERRVVGRLAHRQQLFGAVQVEHAAEQERLDAEFGGGDEQLADPAQLEQVESKLEQSPLGRVFEHAAPQKWRIGARVQR